MTEDQAKGWIAERFGQEQLAQLAAFLALVVAENARQNLVSPSTLEHIWVRHGLDSAQLVPLAPPAGCWIDIGTGGGFPGMVVAILRVDRTILVEPRRKRAEFLSKSARQLGLDHVEVTAKKIEYIADRAAVVSARAVASIEKLLLGAEHCATKDTRWLLPRGRLGGSEVTELRRRWNGSFHVEHSLTDPSSSILVLDRVASR